MCYNACCYDFISRYGWASPSIWRGGRAVYGSGLENRRTCKGTVGSNPTLSAIIFVEKSITSVVGFFCIYLKNKMHCYVSGLE